MPSPNPARACLCAARLRSRRRVQGIRSPVDAVDAQTSTWKPDSDQMRLNGAPVGDWVPVPSLLMEVLRLAQAVGRA
ncbi:FAD:protein FMN transferase [Rhodoligotrophos appendicifer]|uniref:FAD:protein FMN transferase n=1 Tax=Rhodoligotrophos appendicifer TaxID=987056 RepID=UPI0011855688